MAMLCGFAVVACGSERGKRRTKFTGCEGVERAETPGQFDGVQAAVAVERAEKVGCGAATLEGVTFDAAETRLRYELS
jgi:hypothetical protein